LAVHYRWPVGRVPWVRSNFVTTVDGAVQGRDGRSGTINTEADHLVFDLLRALCDVVVVGAGTVRRERYRAIDLTPDQQRIRAAHGLAGVRSEEHTSELQSRFDLVCRLLLVKKR